MNNEQLIAFLIEKDAEYKEAGMIGTIELLITELQTEEEIRKEAKRLVADDKSQS